MSRWAKRFGIGVLLLFFALLICLQSPLNPIAHNQASGTDSSVFRYIAQEMQAGNMPYRDTFDHKGPLLYLINYLGMLISPMHGVWLIELFFIFVALILAYRFARRYIPSIAALVVVTTTFSLLTVFFEGGNLTEEYALPFQLLALELFLRFFESKTQKRQIRNHATTRSSRWPHRFRWMHLDFVLNGFCAAAVLLLRPNMIAIWLVGCLAVLIYQLSHKKYLELCQYISSFILGAFVLLLPILLWLVVSGSFNSFIECYLLFNLHYSGDTGVTDKIQTMLVFLNYSTVSIAFLAMLFCALLHIQQRNHQACWIDLGYSILLIMSLGLVGLSGYTFNHYGMVLLPVLIYPYCQIYLLCSSLKPTARSIAQSFISLYLVSTITLPAFISLGQNSMSVIAQRQDPAFTDATITYIQQHTSPDDMISIFGNQDAIYLYSGRRSASRYSYQYPIAQVNTQIQDEYLSDLRMQLPKIIVVQDDSVTDFSMRLQEFLVTNHYVKSPDLPLYIHQ